jgi:hypothetical protein
MMPRPNPRPHLQAIVVAKPAPAAASIARVPIKPLCLHSRLQEAPEAAEARLAEAWAEFVARRRAETAAAAEEEAAEEAAAAAIAEAAAAAEPAGAPAAASSARAPTLDAGGADTTSSAAQAAALAAVSKAAADPQVSAAALALRSLTPSQSVPAAALPSAFPWCTLTLTGAFSLGQMHEWVGACVPDVPARLIADGRADAVGLTFRNVFVGSHLLVSYRAGSATFRSDNASTIAILKDAISGAAGAVKVRLAVAFDVPPFALRHFLTLLHSRLTYALSLSLKAELYESVKEMVAGDGCAAVGGGGGAGADAAAARAYLHPEFADILANGERYCAEVAAGGARADTLIGVITDAFVDAHKLRGRDVAAGIPTLAASLLPRYHLLVDTHALGGGGGGGGGRRHVRGSEVVAAFMERGS